ncbi:MAG: c-type cytochrome, partial [Blastocatellia bacterium]
MKVIQNRKKHYWKLALVLLALTFAAKFSGRTEAVSDAKAQASAQATFKQYCLQCHTGTAAKAGVNLARLIEQTSVGESFQQWEKVADALEHKTMPPKAMPQPSDEERAQAATWVRATLSDYAKKHDGDPGQ